MTMPVPFDWFINGSTIFNGKDIPMANDVDFIDEFLLLILHHRLFDSPFSVGKKRVRDLLFSVIAQRRAVVCAERTIHFNRLRG